MRANISVKFHDKRYCAFFTKSKVIPPLLLNGSTSQTLQLHSCKVYDYFIYIYGVINKIFGPMDVPTREHLLGVSFVILYPTSELNTQEANGMKINYRYILLLLSHLHKHAFSFIQTDG